MIYFNAVDPAKVTFSADDKELKKKFETNDKTQLIQLLRVAEYSATTFTGKNDVTFTVAYSTRKYIQVESIINIGRTLFICMVLSIAAITFTKDAQVMVLDPLERMIEKVKMIAKNPLSAASDEINEAGIMSFMNKSEQGGKNEKDLKEENKYETAILEKAIVKIGHLLALGFGQAGAGIIGQNMKNNGELDPMMPGVKTYCIFGFCILDDFVATTEVL